MAAAKAHLHLTDINILVSKAEATIRCTAHGYTFEESGPLEKVLASWQKFMDQLPAESQHLAESAMQFAKAGQR